MASTLRGLGRAGLTPAQVVKQVLNTNSLNSADYVSFWTSLQATRYGATKMLIELLGKYVELERQAKKYEKSGKDLDRVLTCILNTIRFLDLFFVIESDQAVLRKALRAYDVMRSEMPATTSTQLEADQVIRTVARSNLDKADTTNALVIECAFVNSVENALLQNSGQRDPTFTVLRDNPFIHLRLVARVLAGGESAKSVVVEIIKQLQSMPAVIRAQPALTNSTLGNVIALLHMLREALFVFPVADKGVLKHALSTVEVLEAWPMPYGKYAGLLAQLIRGEMELPGTALRQRLFEENPLLTPFGSEQSEKYGMQGTDWARGRRSVSVVFNPNIPRAQVVRALVAKPLAKGQAFSMEMSRVREELLACTLETLLTKDAGQAAWHFAVVGALHNKHPADIIEWFEAVSKAVDGRVDGTALLQAAKAISAPLGEGAKLRTFARRRKFDEDDDDDDNAQGEDEFGADDVFVVKEDKRASPRASQLSQAQLQHKPGQKTSNLGSRQAATKDDVVRALEAAPAWSHTVPRVPHLSFDFLEMTSLVESATSGRRGRLETEQSLSRHASKADVRKGGATRSKKSVYMLDALNPVFAAAGEGREDQHHCPQKYLRYPADYEELLRDARAVLPPDQTEGDPLERVRAASEAHASNSRFLLKRVIFGGHDVLHRVLATYVALRAMEPDLCAQIDFRFFLVPVGRNDLAAFISQRDGWYRKHVYVAFHAPLLMVPQIKTGAQDADDRESPVNVPATAPSTPAMAGNRRTSLGDFIGGGIEDASAFDGPRMGDDDDGFATAGGNANGEEPSADRERGHHLDAAPAKLLRYLLADYVRGAEFVFNVFVYDCECWESPDSVELDRGPDLTIPFCERVELGLGAALADYTSKDDFQQGFIGEATAEGLGPDYSLDEVLCDKGFVKAVGGAAPEVKLVTPELSVLMAPMDVDGQLRDSPRDAIELADASYASFNVASVPRYTLPLSSARNSVAVESFEPTSTSANPGFPWLEVQTVAARPALLEALRKKDKKPKDLEAIREALKSEARCHYVGVLDVRTAVSSRLPFLIAVDNQVFGPFYRVRVRPSTALSTSGGQSVTSKAPALHLAVQTFSPVWMGV